MSSGGLGGDALLANAGDLLQGGVSRGAAGERGKRHQEVEHHIDQEIMAQTNQH